MQVKLYFQPFSTDASDTADIQYYKLLFGTKTELQNFKPFPK